VSQETENGAAKLPTTTLCQQLTPAEIDAASLVTLSKHPSLHIREAYVHQSKNLPINCHN
jgi:hypothetical protein